jgi:dCMP deaminase
MKKIDLTNKTFGDLTVLREGVCKIVGKKSPKKRGTWICLCRCGKEKEILACNLIRSKLNTTSCGCKFKNSLKYNFKDLTGQKFGQLLVINKSDILTKTRGALWNCKCDCGNLVQLASNALTSHNNITCGNKVKHQNKDGLDHRWIRCGDIPLSHLNSIKQNATKRNLEYRVYPKYLWELFLQQNRRCPLTGDILIFTPERDAGGTRSIFTTASLDRIDSNIGYIEGNVRWVHKIVNKMRLNMTDEEFLNWCKKCYLNQYQERPSFDEYFLMLAFDISYRSEDPDIKHGAVIIDSNNHIVGSGYNATIKNSDKENIPLSIRDEKRKWMIHAEENAILNCLINPSSYYGDCKMYVTGLPCVNCLQRIINFGVSEIIYADRTGSITENSSTEEMRRKIIEMSKIKVTKFNLHNKWVQKNFLFLDKN